MLYFVADLLSECIWAFSSKFYHHASLLPGCDYCSLIQLYKHMFVHKHMFAEVVSEVSILLKVVKYVLKYLAECVYLSTSYSYCLGNLASHRKMPSGHVKLTKYKANSLLTP